MGEHETGWDGPAAHTAVFARQGGLCALCWQRVSESEMETHHRLRRALMPADALWCPCDLVGLHPRCHTQGPRAVHDQPEQAHELGLVLHPPDDPCDVPVHVEWPWDGPGALLCNGDVGSTLT